MDTETQKADEFEESVNYSNQGRCAHTGLALCSSSPRRVPCRYDVLNAAEDIECCRPNSVQQ